MSLKIATKLVILFTALTMSIVAIFWLKQGHMGAFWTSLGFESGTRMNWCEERVQALYIFEKDARLFEEDTHWQWQQADAESTTLDYLMIEKWFAKYCQLPITPKDSTPTSPASAVFEAEFLGGGRLTLFAYPSGEFKFRTQVFESETLRKALKELLAFADEIE